jgi:hypothetical protein
MQVAKMLRKSFMVVCAAACALSLTPQADVRNKETGNPELAKFLTYYPTTAVGHHGIDHNRIASLDPSPLQLR